ncbi:MAG: hypothetical protein M1835_005438 [Candelina submexicana]|nr:MAG: hypothetical protein M1835_005438 [Candelina submexicana]
MKPSKISNSEDSQKVGFKEANQTTDKHACAPVNSDANNHEHGDDQPRHPQHASSFIDRQIDGEFEPGTTFDSGSLPQRTPSMLNILRADSASLELSASPSETASSSNTPQRHNLKLKSIIKSASLHPPVTKQSLSELDINRIINNIKLRHDVNFDRELHFRPNLDGEKGRQKLEQAESYWKALVAEFVICLSANEPLPGLRRHYHEVLTSLQQQPALSFEDIPKRIPVMFETISEILKTLVPIHHHSVIDARLDVPILMQQINKGLCDFTGLSRWLAELLKAHCAPMRDDWVDNMEEQIRRGVEQANLEAIVEGLKLLFGILETMKLVRNFLCCFQRIELTCFQDVANHQIRSLKPLLIEDTVDFEQKYFLRRIADRRLDTRESAEWFTNADIHAHTDSRLENGSQKRYITVFFEAFVHSLFTPHQKNDIESFAFDQDRLNSLRREICDLIYLETCCRLFSELTRYLEYTGSASSNITLKLRQSIISIVRNTKAEFSWQQNITNVALEIVRTAHCASSSETSTDLELVEFAEDFLRQELNVESEGVRRTARAIEQALIPMVLDRVASYAELSPLTIYKFATPGKGIKGVEGPMKNLEDIAKQIAHVGTLHWRVWCPLVYARSPRNPHLQGSPHQR